MNIEEYIESGIIESYVLGIATPEETASVESLSTQYPEIKKAIKDFELQLEKNAFEHAVTPPKEIHDLLRVQLKDEFQQSTLAKESKSKSAPTPTIQQKVPGKVFSLWKYAAVASIILLLSSVALNYYFYSNYRDTKSNYDALVLANNTLQANNNLYKAKFNSLQSKLKMLEDPDMRVIQLRALPGKESNTATVFWDMKSSDVYLMPTLTAPPSGKEYQLWAIIDGKPVDAGMLQNCDDGMCKMKNMAGVQAFAITLENKGGSKTPDLNAMYLIGKV
ncbi:MAG: anti-sigma factor [Bacteroidetes bacterium]|nr:anti-sigma factor [Bacteroidota bacterium]